MFPSEPENKEECLKGIDNVIKNFRKINTEGCPTDFCVAFERMIQALEDLKMKIEMIPDDFLSVLFSGKKMEEDINEYLFKAKKAADEVDIIAIQYGVKDKILP